MCKQQVKEHENWFVCKWTYDVASRDPLLLLAGNLALIRVINIKTNKTLHVSISHATLVAVGFCAAAAAAASSITDYENMGSM